MLEAITIKHTDLEPGDVLEASGDLVIDYPITTYGGLILLDVLSVELPTMRSLQTDQPHEITAKPMDFVNVARLQEGALEYSAPGGHVALGGTPAVHTDPDEIAGKMRLWHRDEARFSTPEELFGIPNDIAFGAFRLACKWIQSQAWGDDDPDRIAAERMTADEVIACIFLHLPNNTADDMKNWEDLLRAAASWA